MSASPSPRATTLDTRLPTAQPEMTSPKAGWIIGEWYVDVAVAVPDETLPRRLLSLVVLRDGTEVKSLDRPDVGRTVTVPDVPLAAGQNVLTAALRGPGGLGPASEPVTVTQDRDAPVLRITAPKTGLETIESSVTVSGTSEPGASVSVANTANRWDTDIGVGPSGDFEVKVPLAMGRNRIAVSSTDAAGMEQRDAISVVRKDGRPVIKISAPKQVARAELPKLIRISVDVTDVDGAELQDATVSYTLGGPGWTAQDFEDQTDADGRSTWEVELVAGDSGSDPIHRGGGHRSQRREEPGQPGHRDPLTAGRPAGHRPRGVGAWLRVSREPVQSDAAARRRGCPRGPRAAPRRAGPDAWSEPGRPRDPTGCWTDGDAGTPAGVPGAG